MKKIRKEYYFLFSLFFFFSLFSACKKHDTKELISTVEGELLLPDAIIPLQLVAVIRYENVNTRRSAVYEITEKNYLSYSNTLLKGVYNVTIDGTLIYVEDDKQVVRNIRGYSEGLLFLSEKENYKLTLYTYN